MELERERPDYKPLNRGWLLSRGCTVQQALVVQRVDSVIRIFIFFFSSPRMLGHIRDLLTVQSAKSEKL